MGTFVKTTFQLRELSAALLRLASRETHCGLAEGLGAAGAHGGLQPVESSEDVSKEIFQVTKLVLKDVDEAEYALPLPPTPEGAEVLEALQAAVYGSSCAHPSLMQAVLCGSLAQASRMLQLCTAALLDLLSPSNCLAIYNVAAAARCNRLSVAARAYALRNFSAAAQQDYSGLTGLRGFDLMAFLRSDALQVDSELEVFFALATWVEFEPATRMRNFARRLAAAVRLPQLNASDLVFLDSHPLVLKDRMATQVVAHTYLSKVAGLPSDAPFGLKTLTHPRRCERQQEPEGVEGSARRSALAGLVQSLLAADQRARGPDTPAALTAADASVAAVQGAAGGRAVPARLETLLGAVATPTVRYAGETQLQVAAGGSRMRHMELPAGAAARRSLFSAGAGSTSSSLCQEEGPASLETRQQSKGGVSVQLEAAAPIALELAGRVSGLRVDMLISPTKAGIRSWLDTAEAAAPPPAAWGSRKRLRYE